MGSAELDADASTSVVEDEESGAGAAADNPDGSHRGHFFASSESSRTSTTSLHITKHTVTRNEWADIHNVLPCEKVAFLYLHELLWRLLDLWRRWRGHRRLETGP
jgi:hypothetical protein